MRSLGEEFEDFLNNKPEAIRDKSGITDEDFLYLPKKLNGKEIKEVGKYALIGTIDRKKIKIPDAVKLEINPTDERSDNPDLKVLERY